MARLVLEVTVSKERLLEERGFIVKPLEPPNREWVEEPRRLIVAPEEQPQTTFKVDKGEVDTLLRVAAGRMSPPVELQEKFKAASEFFEENKAEFRGLVKDVRSALVGFIAELLNSDSAKRFARLFQRNFILPLGGYAVEVHLPAVEMPNAWEVLAATALAGTPVFACVRKDFTIRMMAPLFRNQPLRIILGVLTSDKNMERMVEKASMYITS